MKLINGDKLKEELSRWDTLGRRPDAEIIRRKLYDLVHQYEINIKSPEEVERILTVIKNKPCKEYSRIAENWIQLILYLIGKVSIFKDSDFVDS